MAYIMSNFNYDNIQISRINYAYNITHKLYAYYYFIN